MPEKVSVILTPVCRNTNDPTWAEPFLQAVQWVFENKGRIRTEARRVTGKTFDRRLLDSWPDKDQVPHLIQMTTALGHAKMDVYRHSSTPADIFEDEVQLLIAFGRLIEARCAKNNLLVSTQVVHSPSLGEVTHGSSKN